MQFYTTSTTEKNLFSWGKPIEKKENASKNCIKYYPFGMQTANSWTRENVTGNNFLGNGGTELNTTSNLYDLDYRNYDPILGRMNGVDPMATKYASLSPYNFSFNDPVTFNDPSGADPDYGITRYTYDDRVDHYRGQFYSGGSTSAMSFHYGGGGSGIINWSYAPSFSQIQRDADAVKSGQMSLNDYSGKYGTSDFGRNITVALLESRILQRNSSNDAGYYKYTGLHGEGQAGVLATFVLFKRQQRPNFNPLDYIPEAISTGLRATVTSGTINWIPRAPINGETAFTEPVDSDDENTTLNVYYDPKLLQASKLNITAVIGHEWIHIAQYRTGAYKKWKELYTNGGAKNIGETNAWGWNNEVYPNVMLPNQLQTPYQMFVSFLTGPFAPKGFKYEPGKYF